MANYIKIIILPLLTVLALAFVWLFVKPIFDSARTLNQVKIPQIESLVQQENDLQQRTEKLSSEISNGNQTEVILNALPENMDTKNLITQIESITNKEKMFLASITIQDDSSADQSADGIFGQSSKDYKEFGGNIEVRGNYGQFKQLIRDFRKLSRITNVNEINVTTTSDDQGGAIGKYTIYFTAFWQPAMTSEDVRSGLESQEFGQGIPAIPGTPKTPTISN